MKFGQVIAVILGLLVPSIGRAEAPAEVVDFPCPYCEADYLLWFVKPVNLHPAILTTGSNTNAVPGALGQPGTRVALGNRDFDVGGINGGRLHLGCWLDGNKGVGVRASGFVLEQASTRFRLASATGSPATYLPFTDPGGVPQALPFTVPNTLSGTSTAVGMIKLWGAEANLTSCLHEAVRPGLWGHHAVRVRLTGLAGWRYVELKERVTITHELLVLGQPRQSARGENEFTARNRFHGAQVGGQFEAFWGPFSLGWTLKAAAGATEQRITVAGGPQLQVTGGANALLPGPLFALPGNVGSRARTVGTFLADVDLALRYQVTDKLRLSLGYGYLAWNRVASAGESIGTTVNLTQLPGRGPTVGPADPALHLRAADFFAHGLHFGAELTY